MRKQVSDGGISRRPARSLFVLTGILVAFGMTGTGRAQNPSPLSSHEAATVCFPPSWDGVVPGVTQDHHMRRLYGDGFLSQEGGHGGTRYFLAEDRSYTVAAEIGVDTIIESVTISKGGDLPKGVPPSRARSHFLPRDPEIYQIHLGLTKARVRALLGAPSAESTDDRWVYGTDYLRTDCYPDANATFTFAHDQVIRFSVYNGD